MSRIVSIILITSTLFFSCLIGMVIFVVNNTCVDLSPLEQSQPARPSVLLDDEGNEWGRFQLDRRDPVKLNAIPQHLIDAFLAAEDRNFFSHPGISLRGILRSVVVNIYRGRRAQGASTITQQLIKLLFFDSKKTFKRKIKEQVMALIVERQFTKEQIIELYLNNVYLGCGIYGVQAGAQRFWGKDVREITVAQAATLAGIVRLPGHYCPLLYPLSSEHRRNVVLHSMHKFGFITQDVYDKARTEELTLVEPDRVELAPHLKETIRLFVQEQFGQEMVYRGGLQIATTLNQKLQRAAQKSFADNYETIKKNLKRDVDGALLSLEVKTGEIKAMVGGVDFSASKFNRALQARRQVGSTLKPLIFAQALMDGATFADTEIDEPFSVTQGQSVWAPNNYDNQFRGQMTLAKSLFISNNIVTIKTFLKLDPYKVIHLAKKCRLNGPFHPYPSLALGCIDATLFEVVGMFNVFANDGVYVEPHFITWVKDAWGTKIYKKVVESERVMPAAIAGQVSQVMGIGFERIRKLMPDKWIDAQAIRKTGTTNDSRTCWFSGSTPTLTTSVYIGCDDNQSMGKDVYPIRTAFPIWLDAMRTVKFNNAKFSFDPSLHEVVVHQDTGAPLYSDREPGAITILM